MDNSRDIRYELNEYLNTVADTLLCAGTKIQTDKDFQRYCQGPQLSSMFLEPIYEVEVFTEINKLNDAKSP
jgi:hypothetical protein